MQSIKGQGALHGAFLWRQVDTVVELKQNWRAKDDAPFVDMLNRIRIGKACKLASNTGQASDYDILKTRLLSELKRSAPEEFDAFNDAPVVVTKKVLRDAINEAKARSFAQHSDQQYEVYCARDKISGVSVTPQQQRRMWKIQSSYTNDALGELPLIPGMPVMITENAATSCKIVNGSKGTLKSITYEVDNGQRYAACALVDIPESALHVPDLDHGVVPIMPVTTSFRFATGEKTISIRRTQLPIVPGWAFTDFKAQGSSLERVIVDLTSARSLQSIYVMLSRAPKLRNIAILRWFSSKTLNSNLQGDAREELKRLSIVARDTWQKYLAQRNQTCQMRVVAQDNHT
ncbi:P-loop containing nucleoside triphosphate hydrolase protein [Suillus variegatus]|nr:P-loop containing nucleoside triphosphate hydrolase protein [Suillus variegatus]